MTRIIDLNDLVADDITIRYGVPPVEYRIPGDIDVETVFALFDAFTQLSSVEGDDPQQVAADVRERFERIRDMVFDLLKTRQPNLDRYPFGIKGTGAVLQVILGELGVSVSAEDPTPPPSTAKRKTAPRRAK